MVGASPAMNNGRKICAAAATFASCGSCRSCREAEPAYCYRQLPLNFSCDRPMGGGPYLCDDTTAIHGDFFV